MAFSRSETERLIIRHWRRTATATCFFGINSDEEVMAVFSLSPKPQCSLIA